MRRSDGGKVGSVLGWKGNNELTWQVGTHLKSLDLVRCHSCKCTQNHAGSSDCLYQDSRPRTSHDLQSWRRALNCGSVTRLVALPITSMFTSKSTAESSLAPHFTRTPLQQLSTNLCAGLYITLKVTVWNTTHSPANPDQNLSQFPRCCSTKTQPWYDHKKTTHMEERD